MLIFSPNLNSNIKIPFALSPICAGFPSPASDYIDQALDLNELLIKHPSSTFYVRATGNSMIGAGIYSGDILVVDRSLKPENGKIVIAILNGEFVVKRLSIKNQCISLISENDSFPNINIAEGMDFEVWGVVTTVIHTV